MKYLDKLHFVWKTRIFCDINLCRRPRYLVQIIYLNVRKENWICFQHLNYFIFAINTILFHPFYCSLISSDFEYAELMHSFPFYIEDSIKEIYWIKTAPKRTTNQRYKPLTARLQISLAYIIIHQFASRHIESFWCHGFVIHILKYTR